MRAHRNEVRPLAAVHTNTSAGGPVDGPNGALVPFLARHQETRIAGADTLQHGMQGAILGTAGPPVQIRIRARRQPGCVGPEEQALEDSPVGPGDLPRVRVCLKGIVGAQQDHLIGGLGDPVDGLPVRVPCEYQASDAPSGGRPQPDRRLACHDLTLGNGHPSPPTREVSVPKRNSDGPCPDLHVILAPLRLGRVASDQRPSSIGSFRHLPWNQCREMTSLCCMEVASTKPLAYGEPVAVNRQNVIDARMKEPVVCPDHRILLNVVRQHDKGARQASDE